MTLKMRATALALGASLALLSPAAGFAKTEAEAAGKPVRIGSFSGAYLAARTAEADNDLDSAIAYYRQAMKFEQSDQTIEQYLMLALISAGRFDEALPLAEKLKAVPEVERFSRLALAVDSIRKGEFKRVETWMKIALESDLDRLIGGLVTAWGRAGDGDTSGALLTVDELSGPEWYELFKTYHRALIAERGGMKAEAKQAYGSALTNLSAGGGAPDVYLRAAEAHAGFLAREGDKAGALAVLDKADEFATGRLPLVKLRADIEAGKTIRPLVPDIRDGAAEVLLDLASALSRGGGEAFVRLYLQYARALDPQNDQVLIQLGQVAEMQRKPEEAIRFYGEIGPSSPLKRAAELQLGLNLADLDRHDEAIPHLKALVAQDPKDMRAYLALGGTYASKEDFKSAAALYDKAAAQLPEPGREDWNIFYQRGIAYERIKQWPKAEPNFRKALELSPDQPQVLNYLGYSWVDMNMNLDEGLAMIQKAVELRPSDGYIVDSLGWAFFRLKRYEEAVEALERAVSLRPEDPVLNDHLGDAYWRAGRKLEATFQWRHARDLKPDAAVLASVNKKLGEGLPDDDGKRADAVPETPTIVADASGAARAEPSTPTEAVSDGSVYRVRGGQTLWSIAAEALGDGRRFQELIDANPVLQRNPNAIRPGLELKLPAR